MMATAHINVDVIDSRVYPVGSDTPLPDESVVYINYDKHILRSGDAVIDATGRLWLVVHDDSDFTQHGYTTLMLEAAQDSGVRINIPAIATPAVRVYHCGEPRHDYIA